MMNTTDYHIPVPIPVVVVEVQVEQLAFFLQKNNLLGEVFIGKQSMTGIKQAADVIQAHIVY